MPEKSKNLRLIKRLISVLIILFIVGVAIWYFTRPKPVSVVLATVEYGDVEATIANTRAGTVNACRRARLAPVAGGQITRLLVKEGQRVQAGQVLLELWNENLAAQRQIAERQLRTTQSHAEEACLLADTAERDATRSKQLKERGFISEERLDRAVSDAKARRAACQAARAETQQAQARINAARAEVSRTVLRAPFSGIVAEVTGELGEFTTPSPPGIPTPPAVDLIDDSCLYVTAPIDEVDAPAIRVGMPARITLDAFSGKNFSGKVRRIAPYVLDVEKQARTVDVEVVFSNPKETQTLLVGYSADAEIILNAHRNVLRIPTQALLEGKRVLVYDNDAKMLKERPVQTGLSNWEYTEVTSGLYRGERIVTSLERENVKAGARAIPEASNQKPKPKQ